MTSDFASTHDRILARLREEFIADAQERLTLVENILVSGVGAGDEPLLAIGREIHDLKGTGSTFGFPSITLISHRLEDYLAGVSELDEEHVTDVEAYIDRLRDIVESGKDPGGEQAAEALRALPAHPRSAFTVTKPLDIEILLVTPAKAIGHVVARELQACGYRVTTTDSPWQAMEMAVYAAPDLVITSVVMDRLSGIDLALALGAMKATEDLPLAVLSSFSRDDKELECLSRDIPLIRLDTHLNDDLAEVIAKFGIA